ncbi:MAG: glutathione-dependent disulfide-bond oxidoreductase [Pseudomonadota bacterium]
MADTDSANNQPPGYVPPKVWTWDSENGGQFANINRPTSGATHEKILTVGKHPIQLYSLGTPNGVKVTIMLEELLAAGHAGAEYDAWLINIGTGDQFGSGFVAINPNSKIPAMMDHSCTPPVRLFESGSMLLYLADKFGAFMPTEPHKRAETINWLMWQMGSAPYVGGGLGHFYAYAPFKMEYPINRFAMETKRQLHVLDTHLATNEYMAGDTYTIADMAIWPWYGSIMREAYAAQEFLSVQDYTHLDRWVTQVGARDAVKRGRMVNRPFGDPATQLKERHDASDFDTNREDMVQARGGQIAGR